MTESRGTLADVAAEAGVSVPTVSKVLNGKSDVAAATRAKVYEAIETTGYLSRRGALRDTSGVLELLIEGADSPWALEIIRGAEAASASRESALVITSSVHESFSLDRWIDALRTRRSAGAVIALPSAGPELVKALQALRIPIVLVDTAGRDAGDFPTVGATNWSGGFDATNRLIELGHRDIGLIAGPSGLTNAVERQEGYAAALRRAGIPYRPELVTEGEFRQTGGYAAGGILLDGEVRPTAIFASSDQQAAGLYEAARERDIRIPSELSVIGFDDTVLSKHLSPTLTTIHQPLNEMAAEAVRLVSELGADPKRRGAKRIELTTYLVERRSAIQLEKD
ncbi:LacI family DNA-binding transcriptional regulator [Planctomonas sp. JC2975]|uniref:substrate-binding domain-containing protein n=1 Tax=Planctomonas sp. JC2975 TaxID=2729626 RepID=UPI001475CF58|nr:LacI family DNA-binding transcriptional regulator [Planctomonas sp. JC2975]